MKKVELLAPAGNYEALQGAIAAGADAVYLGGNAFGARAYADNFTTEEICKGIRFAHLFGKKIYLTVNTLVKEREFYDLYTFLVPFYEAGLDGVIIQDLGVFQFIKKHFPGLSLHVSTQMTITGAYGAEWIEKEGAERIVPARELSLSEIKNIKEHTNLEVETFVHGAMCYCYSGQCLFSSILGGRSGNRGRCAQPCRLPYRVGDESKEQYPLSMKDLCTINLLPQLIEAGIDSFKIEGRMKKPEYAAGVVSVYRKYIDQYYASPDTYQVADEDMQYLKSLYIRSDIMQGYYHKHNGSDMITLSSPAYKGSDENLLAQIRRNYMERKMQLPVSIEAALKKNREACITITWEKVTVTVRGVVVQEAMKQPLTEEKVKEQLLKLGDSAFFMTYLQLNMDTDIFLPISAVNQLRRDAVTALEEKIIFQNNPAYFQRKALPYPELSSSASSVQKHQAGLHVLVGTKKQLQSAILSETERIYIDRHAIDEEFLEALFIHQNKALPQCYLVFPYIVRQKDEKQLERLCQLLQKPYITGALVRNLETLSFLEKHHIQKPIVTDSHLYLFNTNTEKLLQKHAKESYLPLELNKHEIQDLMCHAAQDETALSQVVYGRIPLMISANCLKKTTNQCKKETGFCHITDRYRKEFPVYTECKYCYNIMYNSVPLSLHNMIQQIKKTSYAVRLDFTTEDEHTTLSVIQYFKELMTGEQKAPFYQDFTTGHYKRGVE